MDHQNEEWGVPFQADFFLQFYNFTLPLRKNQLGTSRFNPGCFLSGLANCGSLPVTTRKTLASMNNNLLNNPNFTNLQQAAMQNADRKVAQFRDSGVRPTDREYVRPIRRVCSLMDITNQTKPRFFVLYIPHGRKISSPLKAVKGLYHNLYLWSVVISPINAGFCLRFAPKAKIWINTENL